MAKIKRIISASTLVYPATILPAVKDPVTGKTAVDTISDMIAVETTRATEAEQSISNSLAAEVTRATEAEALVLKDAKEYANTKAEEVAAEAKSYSVVKITTGLSSNVKEAYKLVDEDLVQCGATINVYKDSALQSVELGTAVVNEVSLDCLILTYLDVNGATQTVNIPLGDFLRESEFKDGLQVSGGVVTVKKDSSSESFLSISSAGVKVSGVLSAINTTIANLDLPNTYDAKGSADSAEDNANAYTDDKIDETESNIDHLVAALLGQIDGLQRKNSFDEIYSTHIATDSIAAERMWSDSINVVETNTESIAASDDVTIAGDITVNGDAFVDMDLNVGGDVMLHENVDWYGVSWIEGSDATALTRIGNKYLHATLPVQNAMRGCVKWNSLSAYPGMMRYLSDDWSTIIGGYGDADTATYEALENVNTFVEIPDYWWKFDYDASTKECQLKICDHAKAGWYHHKKSYVSAYEGYNDGTCWRSMPGVVPTVSITRTSMRTAARANGDDHYNIYTYAEHRAICHLFMVEHATRNSQAAVNSTLTADGYKQGGLGAGCTTGTVTIAGAAKYAFIPTGTTDNHGNGTGETSYSIEQTDADGNVTTTVSRNANRYRGIENPFGHIWKHVDDIISIYNSTTQLRTFFMCDDFTNFETNKNDYYKVLTSAAVNSNGYKKTITITPTGDLFARTTNGSQSTAWCDYNYDNTDTTEHCLLIGGCSHNGAPAGLFYLHSSDSVGGSDAFIGGRLTYLP